MNKHKILIIHDIHVETKNGTIGWAFWRRSQALKKYEDGDFEVETCRFSQIPFDRVKEFSLIFNLEYASSDPILFRRNGFRGVYVVSYNSDSNRRLDFWWRVLKHADFVIANNYDVWSHFGRQESTCNISNGFDSEDFYYDTPISERPHQCIFTGSSNPKKAKGWEEVLRPLTEILPERGFSFDFRKVDNINPKEVMGTKDVAEWYNSSSYYIVASDSEGTPNGATESVACGCVLVTTNVGNVREWGVSGENCVISAKTVDNFLSALEYARENREMLSANGLKTIQDWSYGSPGNRAKYFFQLFRRLIEDGPGTIRPFSFLDRDWSEI